VRGAFHPDSARIELSGYVCRADHPLRRYAELYFLLCALETLLHEVAHHGDEVRRRGRGERAGATRREQFAGECAHRWFGKHALPYVRKAHPAGVDALLAWVEERVGVQLPLDALAGGASFHGRAEPLRMLLEWEAADDAGVERSIELAAVLHHGEMDNLARAIADRVLVAAPEHHDALALLACIALCNRSHAEARRVIDRLLAAHPDSLRGASQRVRLLFGERDWAAVIDAADRVLALERRPRARAGSIERLYRARALLETRAYEELDRELVTLMSVTYRQHDAQALRAIRLLRGGRTAEALALAETGLVRVHRRRGRGVSELRAVRWQALRRLGRATEAGALREQTLRTLDRLGHEVWVAELRGEQSQR
jgi:hypothetical protein